MTKQEWREARKQAYERGEYTMSIPAVTTGRWDIIAWCNYVCFNDKALRGYDDRN